jgi:uncharacterized protein YcgI (DUF1989 family)
MKIIEEFVIPKCEGRSFKIKKGHILRIIEIEGVQAADMIAFNLYDFKESYSAWLTRNLSLNFTRVNRLYSKLPKGNIMFTLLTDIPGVYWLSPGRCNRLFYELHYGQKEYHKNCQDILAGCIKPYGMSEYDVPDVFNIFMRAILHKDGSVRFKPSPVKKGDYVDLRAEMDCLVAISACPDELGSYNDFKTKPLEIQIRSNE